MWVIDDPPRGGVGVRLSYASVTTSEGRLFSSIILSMGLFFYDLGPFLFFFLMNLGLDLRVMGME